MYQHADPLYLICETPLHAGSGDDLGIVDLPIQRERHTNYPKVESASIKGSLRTAFERKAEDDTNELIKIHAAFGYDEMGVSEKVTKAFEYTENAQEQPDNTKNKVILQRETQFAGCLGFTDARLLFFPVKSMRGVFAWVTCQQVINRYYRDRGMAETFPAVEKGKVGITKNSALTISNDKIVLEEYTFVGDKNNPSTDKLADEFADILFAKGSYHHEKFKTSLVVLPDDAFKDFVTLSTEVITRIKIDNETGTVRQGALFTEEFLPTESILYTLVLTGPLFMKEALLKKNSPFFKDFLNEENKPDAGETRNIFKNFIDKSQIFQLGGNASLGKGIVRTVFKPEEVSE
ncbi:type III-B CRISPR module RAMP protein Cmr4 [Thioflexithrix psekupsensis]|uniref:Type III-B CRISPR module RAMP protein Cmr4 n=1 Tax=Thioflexithrix psekupsensis TaxID=1570016 RepID=A0A251X9Y6_9GAMM|nr:type III-B CRISPR module RAMP protein Cmr4 [Thioflexithrix psekupsensis]OUD14537.1 type III-B CRISPR module RAMP protein Cmr4 [Thioflexithrix psekupsensis]